MDSRIKKIIVVVAVLVILFVLIGGLYAWLMQKPKQNIADLIGQQVTVQGIADEQLSFQFFSLKGSRIASDHGVYVIAPASFMPEGPFGKSKISVVGDVQLFDVQKYNESSEQPLPESAAVSLSGKPVIVAKSVTVEP